MKVTIYALGDQPKNVTTSMKIPRQPIVSSQIESIGHSIATNEMDIEFKPFKPKPGQKPKKGSVYRYQNVTQANHQALINAESIGRHFGANIKNNTEQFPCRKLTEEESAQ